MENRKLITRPPVVVILGHVDHGKSSILESIKDLKITSQESGGITQHIAAYQIEHEGKQITFIDTPGHEAFSGMRSRGSKVADIAILVIASEEGIKPQTKEAIKHIKSVGIPMIVVLNKIDKPEADPEKVKRALMTEEIIVESMGGKIPSVNVSAQTNQGIDEMLEVISLIAEMENLKVDINASADGVVIESRLDSKRGVTSTLIIKSGTLKNGDVIGTYSTTGKVKIIEDFRGNTLEVGTPSMPVLVIGFDNPPIVGEYFRVFDSIGEARDNQQQEKELPEKLEKVDQDSVLKLIIKADVSGSLEAIKEILKTIPQEKAIIQILKAEIGDINDSDIKLAKISEAMTVGFRVKTNNTTQKLALRERVRIVSFDVIYQLEEAVRTALEKKIAHETVRKDLGKMKVLTIFKTDKNSQILGCRVIDGEILKGASLEIYRNEEKVGAGKVSKIQKEKKEVGEASKGSECGILYKGDIIVEEDDELLAYSQERYKPGLE